MADQFPFYNGHAVNVGNMFPGHDERMNGGLWVKIFKRDRVFVIMDDFGGNLLIDDFTENAIRVRTHGRIPRFLKPVKETTPVSRMTRRSGLVYFDQKRVLIAVIKNLLDMLHVARGLPFLPKLPAGPAPKPGKPALNGFLH